MQAKESVTRKNLVGAKVIGRSWSERRISQHAGEAAGVHGALPPDRDRANPLETGLHTKLNWILLSKRRHHGPSQEGK